VVMIIIISIIMTMFDIIISHSADGIASIILSKEECTPLVLI